MSNINPYSAAVKNQPWARATGASIQQQLMNPAAMVPFQQQASQQQQQQQQQHQNAMFQSALHSAAVQQQQQQVAAQQAASLGMGLQMTGQMFQQQQQQVNNVSYPARATLNPNAFQPGVGVGVPQQVVTPGGAAAAKQRVFTGTVTKVHDNFGFVDEDVFFQTTACGKGSLPNVGDRVLVDASFNPTMPFKWNATRIQVLSVNKLCVANANLRNAGQTKNYLQSSPYSAVPPPKDHNANGGNYNNRTGGNSAGNNRNKNMGGGGGGAGGNPNRGRERSRDRDRSDRSSDAAQVEEQERKRRREERMREREKEEKKPPVRSSRATARSRSPKSSRRRSKIVPRYMVQIPKIALDKKCADVWETSRRYKVLYIPSDFFSSHFRWMDAFPAEKPLTLNKPCSFHIMNKDVNSAVENDSVLEPPDADYSFSAKVMLMSVPGMEYIYQKCCGLAEDRDKPVASNVSIRSTDTGAGSDDGREHVHPARHINFLVGIRGKNETMAIGGPWSPSLDGQHPERDPSVLIKTAVRCCRALTGIDLSHCTKWYRFVELYYRRGTNKEAEAASSSAHSSRARVETVVIFLPDVWSCLPTRLEWEALNVSYRRLYDERLLYPQGGQPLATTEAAQSQIAALDSSPVDISSAAAAEETMEAEAAGETVAATDSEVGDELDNHGDEAVAADESSDAIGEVAANDEDDEGDETMDTALPEPTHYSDLDVKSMKVAQLRAELNARELSDHGFKYQLVSRLQQALKDEEAAEAQEQAELDAVATEANIALDECQELDDMESDNVDLVEAAAACEVVKLNEKVPVADSKPVVEHKLDEKERILLEKRHQLPDEQHIIVHPSRTAKNGKFDCTVMSLSLLLDYRLEDTKEHSFEVSLFAELFNEMLMRDFGFNIYRALCVLPDKPKEEPKKDKEKEKKSDDTKKRGNDDKDAKKSNGDKKGDDKEKDKKKDSSSRNKPSDDKKSDRGHDSADEDDYEDDDGRDRKSTRGSTDKKKRDKVKMYTKDRNLLLSFIYFDANHCGYIHDSDLEDLLYTLGLSLSRAQVRRLLNKVISGYSLHYRKLTDKPKDDDLIVIDDSEKEANVDKIAMGNKRLLPIFQSGLDNTLKRPRLDSQAESEGPVETTSNLVMFRGALVDILKLQEQLERSNNARLETEARMIELKSENTRMAEKQVKSATSVKQLTSDLRDTTDKLRTTEDDLQRVKTSSELFQATLTEVADKIGSVLQTTLGKGGTKAGEREHRKDEVKSRWEKEDSKPTVPKDEPIEIDCEEKEAKVKAESEK